MEKCKLLRLFILCNCIVLSVQTFGMDGTTMYVTMGGVGIMGQNVRTKTYYLDKKKDRSHNDNKDIETTKSTPADLPGWQYKGLTSGNEIVHQYKIPGSFKELCVNGVKRNLILTIENLHDDQKEAYLKVVGELALVSAFLDRKKDNSKFTIATPSQYDTKFGDLNKACAVFNIPSQLSVTLLLPKVWENLHINGNNVEIKGSIYNKNPRFNFEDCSIAFKGQSDKDASFDLMGSKFDGSNYRVNRGIVSVLLRGKSNMTCNGSLNSKKPTVFMGSKEKTSEICLYGNVTNDVNDVE